MKGYSLTGCGGVGSATGANFLVKTPETNFLVDCGLVQGSKFAVEENRSEFLYRSQDISFLFVTHAHMDHIGRIPKLVKEGFSGIIYSTAETKELAALMLDDAQNLLAREAQEAGVEPLYEKTDIGKAMTLWKTVSYHENLEVTKDVSAYFMDAGHILGSSIIEISLKGIDRKIAFTGDLGNSPTPLLRDTEFVTGADYMVIESVYGDRNHEPKDERDRKLEEILRETLRANGTVVIPAFSLERTQVILHAINDLIEAKRIPLVPVFLDSPLAIKVTQVYKRYVSDFNAKVQEQIAKGDDIFDFTGLRIVRDHMESNGIHSMKGAKIIIAGSGMSVGGRVLSHEAFYLEDPEATLILVGYQVPGSLGRLIEEKSKKLHINGKPITVRARIEKISGYSSHKDSNNLVDFVSHAAKNLKTCFVAMGENKSSAFLAQRINSELGVHAVMQEKGVEYHLR